MFLSAAEATIGVMIENPRSLKENEQLSIELKNDELDMLLFDFLQEIIFFKDSCRLLLRITSLRIDRTSSPLTLAAEAGGEIMIQGHHALLTDVKAVTLYRFGITQNEKGWTATVILDI
jgi:SHS2 domain-containing protein